MDRAIEYSKLEASTHFIFPRKIDNREFVKMLEFIDRVVFPSTTTYWGEVKGVVGMREEESGETLAHHKYVERGLHGTVTSATDSMKRATFFVSADNDYSNEYLVKTRCIFSSLKFDVFGYNSLEELKRGKSTDIEVIQRVGVGIEVYFAEHPNPSSNKRL